MPRKVARNGHRPDATNITAAKLPCSLFYALHMHFKNAFPARNFPLQYQRLFPAISGTFPCYIREFSLLYLGKNYFLLYGGLLPSIKGCTFCSHLYREESSLNFLQCGEEVLLSCWESGRPFPPLQHFRQVL